MSEYPDGYIRIENGDFYQQVAFDAQRAIFSVMNQLAFGLAVALDPENKEPSGVDAGPLLGGAIGGILQFAMNGGLSDAAQVRQTIIDQMDVILPQIAMDQALEQAGAVGSGRA